NLQKKISTSPQNWETFYKRLSKRVSEERRVPRLLFLTTPASGRVNGFANLRYCRSRKSADLCVLMNERLVFGQIDAEHLVRRNIGLHPLDLRAELTQYVVGFVCGLTQLFALQAAHLRDFTLNEILLHIFLLRHDSVHRLPVSISKWAEL